VGWKLLFLMRWAHSSVSVVNHVNNKINFMDTFFWHLGINVHCKRPQHQLLLPLLAQ
jgi:hypothetical protein